MQTEPIFRPMEHAPDRDCDYRKSRFSASWDKVLRKLDYELQRLGAERVIIQLDCAERHIRVDGWPRCDARVFSPAVSISFECERGYLTYPCNTFEHWQDNLYAIAMGLEALRAVDRYGITQNGQQYTGWKALTYRAASFDTSQQAADWLAELPFIRESAENILTNGAVCKEVLREAKTRLHPDGSEPHRYNFQLALAARETLERHHNTLRLP